MPNEMESVTQVEIMDEAVWATLCAHAVWNKYASIYSPNY